MDLILFLYTMDLSHHGTKLASLSVYCSFLFLVVSLLHYCRYVALKPQKICQSVSIIAITWKAFGKVGMLLTINGLSGVNLNSWNKISLALLFLYLTWQLLVIPFQVHVHSSRGIQKESVQCLDCIHICCNLAWFRMVCGAFILLWSISYLRWKHNLFNVCLIFHRCRKLLWWAWLTCLFFVPEMVVKSAVSTFKVTFLLF